MKKLILIFAVLVTLFAVSCSTDPTKTTLAEKAGTYSGTFEGETAKAVIAADGKSITMGGNSFDTSADADKKGSSYGPYTKDGVSISLTFVDESSVTVSISFDGESRSVNFTKE